MHLFLTTTSSGTYSFQIAYFTILLFQFVYISVQLTYVYRKEYIYYLLYILCMAVYYLAANENLLGLSLFFTKYPHLQKYFDKPAVIMCSFLYYRFARYFLDVPEKYLSFNKLMQRMENLLFAGLLAEVIFLANFGEQPIEEILFLALSTSMCLYSIYLIYKLKSFALNNFIVAGALLIIVGAFSSMLLFNLGGKWGIPPNIIPSIPSQLTSVVELLIFTTALGYKTYLLEREKLKTERALVKELRENEVLQGNLQQLRNKIAGDLHDDMGATLGSINVYADVSERMIEEGNKDDAKNYLGRITELSKESLNDMRNMLWSLNPEHDTVQDLTTRMKDYAQPLLAAKEIHLIIDTEHSLLHHKISVLQKRNLFLIFKEATHNIIKYSACTDVRVSVTHTKKQLQLLITDNGCGFDTNKQSDGNGLRNIERRAKEINGGLTIISTKNKGTQIVALFQK